MNPTLLPEVFSLVVAVSWRVGLLVLVLVAMRRLVRGRVPAQLWFGVWVIVALRLLIPLGVPIPASPPATPAVASGREPAGPVSPQPTLPEVAMSSPSEVATLPAALAWHEWLPVVWLAGVVALGVARGWAAGSFRRRLNGAAPVTEPRWRALVTEEAGAARLSRPIRSFETAHVDAPALCGWWQPRLLLPVGLAAKLTEDEQRFIIRHELGHWRRKDLLIQMLIQAAVVVHWFNPLVWLAARLARTDCELACDEHVLRREAPGGAEAYGAALLKVLGLVSERPRPLAVVGLLENRSRLADRIRRIAGYQAAGGFRQACGMALVGVTTALAVMSFTRELQAAPAISPEPVTASDVEQRARTAAMRDSYRALNEVLEGQKLRVEKLAEQLLAFKERYQITDPTAEHQSLAEQLRAQNLICARLRMDLSLAEVQQDQLKKAQEGGEVLKLSFVAEQPEVRAAYLKSEQARATYTELGLRYLDRHPRRMAARDQWDATKAELDRATAAAVQSLFAAYQLTSDKLQLALKELDRLKKESLNLDRRALEYSNLERDLKLQEQMLTSILNRSREVSALVTAQPAAPAPAPEAPSTAPLKSVKTAGSLLPSVTVSGEVNRAGRILITSGQTSVVEAVGKASGFTRYGNKKQVRISRQESDGAVRVFIIDLDAFMRGQRDATPDGDFKLQDGDEIVVPRVEAKSPPPAATP